VQSGVRGRNVWARQDDQLFASPRGKRGGESNKTRAKQGGMQPWNKAQLYGWRWSERAKRRAKRDPSDKITAGVGLSSTGWGALAQLEACVAPLACRSGWHRECVSRVREKVMTCRQARAARLTGPWTGSWQRGNKPCPPRLRLRLAMSVPPGRRGERAWGW
jgi:hypothetical protein